MTTLTVGRHRAIRSHRRPRPTLGQLARTIRERITRRAEGQPETAGVTAQPERTPDMAMMDDGRWSPGPKPPTYDPKMDFPPHDNIWCRDARCRQHFPLMAEVAEAADKANEQTLFLDPFTVRPYVLRSSK